MEEDKKKDIDTENILEGFKRKKIEKAMKAGFSEEQAKYLAEEFGKSNFGFGLFV